MSILITPISAFRKMKITSAITEKLVFRMSPLTENPMSLNAEPSVMNRTEKSSSASVRTSVSKAGARNVSSRESSLSRRAVAMPNV